MTKNTENLLLDVDKFEHQTRRPSSATSKNLILKTACKLTSNTLTKDIVRISINP